MVFFGIYKKFLNWSTLSEDYVALKCFADSMLHCQHLVVREPEGQVHQLKASQPLLISLQLVFFGEVTEFSVGVVPQLVYHMLCEW